jgi:hypothetical protein
MLINCGQFEVMSGSNTNQAVVIGKMVSLAFESESLSMVRHYPAAKWCIGDFGDGGYKVHTRTRVMLTLSDPERDVGYVVYLPDPKEDNEDEDDWHLNGYWLRPVDAVAKLFVLTGDESVKKHCKVQA